MTAGPVRTRPNRLGLRIFVLGVAFALFAELGLFMVPLAALCLAGPVRGRGAIFVAAAATGFSLWWLGEVGHPPAQVVRAATVMVAVVYVALSHLTRLTHVHRALAALGTASLALVGMGAALRRSWTMIHWWVLHDLDFSAQMLVSSFWVAQPAGGERSVEAARSLPAQMERWADQAVPVLADLFPATVAVQGLAGLSLAAVVYLRLGGQMTAGFPGPFAAFRFSEHLGWALVASLGALMLGTDSPFWLWGINGVVFLVVLYAVRGLAVGWFYLTTRRGLHIVTLILLGLSVVFLMPVVLGALVTLGVTDGRLDLRKQWSTTK